MRSIDDRLRSLLSREAPAKKQRTVRRRKRKTDHVIDVTRLCDLSETELVAVAHLAGYKTASRQMLRDDLIALILGEADEPMDCLSGPRELTYAYVKANEAIMASMMPCDLHCPTCPHHQVVECYTTNRDLVE